jgi:CRP-like cAMP-binding protein
MLVDTKGAAGGEVDAGGTVDRIPQTVIERFMTLADLSLSEKKLLQDIRTLAHYDAGQTLRSDNGVSGLQLLLSGWVCHQRILSDGRRQIIDFMVPGDPIDGLESDSSTAIALTAAVTLDASALSKVADTQAGTLSGLASAMQLMAMARTRRLYDHVVRLGGRSAYERLLHLLLDFHDRLAAVGLVTDHGFALPITQETLADSLGMSKVHMNRTLQQIRSEAFVQFKSGHVRLLDIDRLRAICI